MNNVVVAVIVLPILAIVGFYALPPVVNALFATLQELARAYPLPTFIALVISVVMMLFFSFAKR